MKYTVMYRMCRDDGRDNWSCWDEDPYLQPQEGNPADILNDYLAAVEENFRATYPEFEIIDSDDMEITYHYMSENGYYVFLEIRVQSV